MDFAEGWCGGGAQCLTGHSLSYTIFNAFLRWCVITLVFYLIILLVYYIFYKSKKDQNPLKHAFKRTTRLLGIVVFILIPIMCIGMTFLNDWIYNM